VILVVDRAGGSLGMTVGEVADLLIKDYAVEDALNLDGGGSSSLAIEDPVTKAAGWVNVSSDNPAGRAVADSLAIFAQPLARGR
jgi:exopolysaccharide biosynthesis protein